MLAFAKVMVVAVAVIAPLRVLENSPSRTAHSPGNDFTVIGLVAFPARFDLNRPV